MIKEIYTGDSTEIMVNDQKIKMCISSGIRQGCTASTTLFKLIIYDVIEKLESLGKGYEDDILKLSVLFFADDGLVLAIVKIKVVTSSNDNGRVREKYIRHYIVANHSCRLKSVSAAFII